MPVSALDVCSRRSSQREGGGGESAPFWAGSLSSSAYYSYYKRDWVGEHEALFLRGQLGPMMADVQSVAATANDQVSQRWVQSSPPAPSPKTKNLPRSGANWHNSNQN